MSDRRDARLEQLLEVMLAMARQDFAVRATVGEEGDVVDGIAVGLNMLLEELQGEVASREELERAHDELKYAQAKLVHAGKLAAIGQLAAGVAHEINNPLQGIEVCLSIVERTHEQLLGALTDGALDREGARLRLDRSRRAILDAHEAIDRVRGVTTSLRTFARADDDTFTAVQLDDVVRVSCRLSESTIRMRARLALELPAVPLVRGNRGKLGQVVTNLVLNAIQAIPEGAAERHVVRIALESRGDEVRLRVEDSGPGVPAGQEERIFEPFFTTKAPDLGTGLGLALVAEIVRAHEGSVSVRTSELGGACFEVVLPTTRLRDSAPTRDAGPTAASRPRLLLIDDEEMLLRLFKSLLADECDVVIASGGRAALDVLASDREFDLVLCDMHMPEVDGVDVYEALAVRAPGLCQRFAFATGGAVTERARTFLDRNRVRVLHKPFEIAALLALLNVSGQGAPSR